MSKRNLNNLYSDPKEEYPLTKATAGHFWPLAAVQIGDFRQN
jgi:hypothetical protein